MPKGAHLECKKLVYARTTEHEVGGVILLRRLPPPPALGAQATSCACETRGVGGHGYASPQIVALFKQAAQLMVGDFISDWICGALTTYSKV